MFRFNKFLLNNYNFNYKIGLCYVLGACFIHRYIVHGYGFSISLGCDNSKTGFSIYNNELYSIYGYKFILKKRIIGFPYLCDYESNDIDLSNKEFYFVYKCVYDVYSEKNECLGCKEWNLTA